MIDSKTERERHGRACPKGCKAWQHGSPGACLRQGRFSLIFSVKTKESG